MHLFKFFPEVAQHVWLVVELKNDDEHNHVDCKEQKDDQDELGNNLRSQAHLSPARSANLLARPLDFLLFVFFFRVNARITAITHTSLHI